ncbi:PHD finger protein 12-like [Pundamilia nyererei]|uniref:PHD finger protein 12-like n=1 Tax=Pundamilia nyererei TaxID=303518 RepID=A0A9Y3S304_9CICH|nr:PREDICTED: PHD finger protein 12-like [Pundamilia nyererei]
MKDGKEEDGGIELDKLDTEMIKLLAYQRIQQLFAPKVPSTQPPPTTSTTPKTSAPHPNSQKKVQARAVFYPLTGRGAAVSMCYRTLHIGSALIWRTGNTYISEEYCSTYMHRNS